MADSEKEDVFDFLRKATAYYEKQDTTAEIPTTVWESAFVEKKQAKKKTTPNGFKIPNFDFEINGEYFVSGGFLNVNSLFFHYVFNYLFDNVTDGYRSITDASLSVDRSQLISSAQKLTGSQFLAINFVSKTEISKAKTAIVEENTVEKILRTGIKVDGKLYSFLGCSNSGLHRRSLYFMQGSLEDCQKLLDGVINFSALKNDSAAKCTKYVGFLFAGCEYIVQLPSDLKIFLVPNVLSSDQKYNFTDGCGLISYALAKWIWKNNEKTFQNWTEVPSVLQICYNGGGIMCKGVLLVDYREKTKNCIRFRKSMVKVNHRSETRKSAPTNLDYKLGIVSVNSRPKIGKLNKQVIALLTANIPEDTLLEIQDSFLKQKETARRNVVTALQC